MSETNPGLLTVRQSVREREPGWFKRGLAHRNSADHDEGADENE